MISVIVPVYNVEKYLDKCIQSILKQTYKDFELILVDDGSLDNSPQMCDEYAQKDKRVKVIHKANGGLSDARNVGTLNASGQYVTYIDSDDYVSDDYLEVLNWLIIKYNADMAVTGISVFYEGDQPKKSKRIKEYVYTGEKALEKMLYQDTLDTSACAMLLPIQIAREYPFPYGKYHEDEFTTYKYYAATNKIAVTTKKQYFYLQRKGSIMHVFGQASLDELEAADNLVAYCEKKYPNLVPAAKSKKYSDYCQVLLSTSNFKIKQPEIYSKIEKYLLTTKNDMLRDKSVRLKNKISAMILIFGLDMLCMINKLINK